MRIKTGLLLLLMTVVTVASIEAGEPVPHPNPWKYNINNSSNGGIDFFVRNDATKAVLKIYSLGGDLVRDMEVTDLAQLSGGTVTWNGLNREGWLVCGGIYFYYLEVTYAGGTEEYKGKIVFVN